MTASTPLLTLPDLPVGYQTIDGRPDTDAAPTAGPQGELFGPRMRRAELTAAYPELARVCDFLGFGDGPCLGDWSRSPRSTLLAFARAAQPPKCQAQIDWSMATIPELICHIVCTHHYTLRNELARLRLIIDHVAEAQPATVFTAVSESFADYRDTMLFHLQLEETDLFPRCIKLENASLGRCIWDDHDVTPLIRCTGHGHEEFVAGLERIQRLAEAAATVHHDPDLAAFITGLTGLAQDLAMHIEKESDFLIPAAIFAEDQLHARRARTHR